MKTILPGFSVSSPDMRISKQREGVHAKRERIETSSSAKLESINQGKGYQRRCWIGKGQEQGQATAKMQPYSKMQGGKSGTSKFSPYPVPFLIWYASEARYCSLWSVRLGVFSDQLVSFSSFSSVCSFALLDQSIVPHRALLRRLPLKERIQSEKESLSA
jgi:hypothetical protein